jgi:hypothetical protein
VVLFVDVKPTETGLPFFQWDQDLLFGMLDGVAYSRVYDNGSLLNYDRCREADLQFPISYTPMDPMRRRIQVSFLGPEVFDSEGQLIFTDPVTYELWQDGWTAQGDDAAAQAQHAAAQAQLAAVQAQLAAAQGAIIKIHPAEPGLPIFQWNLHISTGTLAGATYSRVFRKDRLLSAEECRDADMQTPFPYTPLDPTLKRVQIPFLVYHESNVPGVVFTEKVMYEMWQDGWDAEC